MSASFPHNVHFHDDATVGVRGDKSGDKVPSITIARLRGEEDLDFYFHDGEQQARDWLAAVTEAIQTAIAMTNNGGAR
jgi:hypothetical protein